MGSLCECFAKLKLKRKEKSLRSFTLDSFTVKSEGTPRSESSVRSGEILITPHGLRIAKQKTEFHKFLRSNDLSTVLISRNRLQTGKLLAIVNKMRICNGTLRTSTKFLPVNVHILTGINNDEEKISILDSVRSLRHLKHPNIQIAKGACIEGGRGIRDGFEVLLITTERVHKHVTLKRLLEWALSNNSSLLTQHCALNFVVDICKGVNYLEENHLTGYDLTTSTCSIDIACRVKVSDLHWNSYDSELVRWRPPQSNCMTWTIGVVMWEIFSFASLPYSNIKANDLPGHLLNGLRLSKPENCSWNIYKAMHLCWHKDQDLRPSVRHLINLITGLLRFVPNSAPAHQLFPDTDQFEEDEYFPSKEYSFSSNEFIEDEYI
ncbi:DgyrCDS9853 [Dimorphilus gyrociliatus]|uniref:DgyrCDS9853 n=1 Tax=Dimorphilus gyrociliatus TaxID=2664684 RepID=A0A7I8VYK8_9ANNE|nr:DgyrCDS9853 [Dimorphilus gyrociliatus]